MTTVSVPNNIEILNAFCRRYDLVFVEFGRVRSEDIYWFVDFNNQRRYYSMAEIRDKLE